MPGAKRRIAAICNFPRPPRILETGASAPFRPLKRGELSMKFRLPGALLLALALSTLPARAAGVPLLISPPTPTS